MKLATLKRISIRNACISNEIEQLQSISKCYDKAIWYANWANRLIDNGANALGPEVKAARQNAEHWRNQAEAREKANNQRKTLVQ